MANLRLTALEKEFNSKTPKTVDELSNLSNKVETIYSDVKFDILDLNSNGIYINNSINSAYSLKDIDQNINEEAVLNSVKNWFKTDTFCHLLNPKLTFSIGKYLFEPLNEYTAYFMATDIVNTLPAYEPRIQITNCEIFVDYEHDAYHVTLKMIIPALNNKEINFKDILSESGYSTL